MSLYIFSQPYQYNIVAFTLTSHLRELQKLNSNTVPHSRSNGNLNPSRALASIIRGLKHANYFNSERQLEVNFFLI